MRGKETGLVVCGYACVLEQGMCFSK